jgi:hypothetical protein
MTDIIDANKQCLRLHRAQEYTGKLHLTMWFIFNLQRKRNMLRLSTHTNKISTVVFFSGCLETHYSIAYVSHSMCGWCRRDVVHPRLMFLVYYTTSPTIASQMFFDALTGSSHGNEALVGSTRFRIQVMAVDQ